MAKRFLRVTNLLFLILLAVQFLPDITESCSSYVIGFAVIAEIVVLIVSAFSKNKSDLFLDIMGALYVLLIVWTLASAKFGWLRKSLFPPPEEYSDSLLRTPIKYL